MSISSRTGLLGIAFIAACTIRVQQSGGEGTPDAECLELFETCVELAGESPGCTEVYQFCQGSVSDTDAGGGGEVGDCEQTYIDCLEQGSSTADCQPLLDMCMPPEPESTTGVCFPGEPGCPIGDGSTGLDPTQGCSPEDSACVNNCEQTYLNCTSLVDDESVCVDIRDACETGDCQVMTSICLERIGATDVCQQITGCGEETPDECQQVLNECASQGLTDFECRQQWPEYAHCFPEQGQCDWYDQECQNQYTQTFCADAREACAQGFLPEVFDCSEFFQNYCGSDGENNSACDVGEQQCENGFFETAFCSQTRLWEDPYQWLQELSECNGWGNG